MISYIFFVLLTRQHYPFLHTAYLTHCYPSQQTMAGFRQEDVEVYYDMGEELGR